MPMNPNLHLPPRFTKNINTSISFGASSRKANIAPIVRALVLFPSLLHSLLPFETQSRLSLRLRLSYTYPPTPDDKAGLPTSCDYRAAVVCVWLYIIQTFIRRRNTHMGW